MGRISLNAYRDRLALDFAFPTVLGAAVTTYNIPGVATSLQFTRTRWPESWENIKE